MAGKDDGSGAGNSAQINRKMELFHENDRKTEEYDNQRRHEDIMSDDVRDLNKGRGQQHI